MRKTQWVPRLAEFRSADPRVYPISKRLGLVNAKNLYYSGILPDGSDAQAGREARVASFLSKKSQETELWPLRVHQCEDSQSGLHTLKTQSGLCQRSTPL